MRYLLMVPCVTGALACGDGAAGPVDAAGPDAALGDVVDPVPLIDPTIGTGGLGQRRRVWLVQGYRRRRWQDGNSSPSPVPAAKKSPSGLKMAK